MPIVPEEVLEETWQRVGSMKPSAAMRMMKRITKRQPSLLAYVMACIDDADQDVKELATYMLVVILSAFEAMPGCRVRKVSEKSVEQMADRNDELMAGLEGAHERFQERIAQSQLETQPHLVGYILECLFEEPAEVPLDEMDQGLIFLTLKTVVDLLNEACQPVRGG